ncbi:MAG: hypothetical protein ACREMD_14750 [Gemmatimonadota bacterium]
MNHRRGVAFTNQLNVRNAEKRYTGYVVMVVWGLAAIDLWEASLLKDTVIWFLFSGLVLAFSGVATGSKQEPFRAVIREQISLLVPVEFLINAYTFSLSVELVLIPVLVFMGLVEVVSEYKNDFDHARRAASRLRAVAGWVMLAFVLARFLGDLATHAVGRDTQGNRTATHPDSLHPACCLHVPAACAL